MPRLLTLLPAAVLVLSTAPVFAQEAPSEAYRTLWCGLAFSTAGSEPGYSQEDVTAAKAAGANATPEQQGLLQQDAVMQQFVSGGADLIEQAGTAYKEAGFTDETFNTAREALDAKVKTQVSGTGEEAEFAFDDCVTLLPTNPMSTMGGGMTETPAPTMAPEATPSTTTEATPSTTPEATPSATPTAN